MARAARRRGAHSATQAAACGKVMRDADTACAARGRRVGAGSEQCVGRPGTALRGQGGHNIVGLTSGCACGSADWPFARGGAGWPFARGGADWPFACGGTDRLRKRW
eukprot:1036415-Prymnesium_polylepis.2